MSERTKEGIVAIQDGGEDASFLEDDSLWDELSQDPPSYATFERALASSKPARPSAPAQGAVLATPPARPGLGPKRSSFKTTLPAQLLPKPGAGPPPKKPPVLAAPPTRPGARAKVAAAPAPSPPKPAPPLAPRPALPKPAEPSSEGAAATEAAAAGSPPPLPLVQNPAERPSRPGAKQQDEEQLGPRQVVETAAGEQSLPQQDVGTADAEHQAATPEANASAPMAQRPQWHDRMVRSEASRTGQPGDGGTSLPKVDTARFQALGNAAVADTALAALLGRAMDAEGLPQAEEQQPEEQQPSWPAPELEQEQEALSGLQPLDGAPEQPGQRSPQLQSMPPSGSGFAAGIEVLEEAARQGLRQSRQSQALQLAQACLDAGRPVRVEVWQVHSAGVMVKGERLCGFIPMKLLSTRNGLRVLQEEARLAQQAGGGGDPNAAGAATAPPAAGLRREAMKLLLGETLKACVVEVRQDEGQVVLSERAAEAWQAQVSPEALEVAEAALPWLGQVVPATILTVKSFGCFVDFEIPPAGAPGTARQGQQPAAAAGAAEVAVAEAEDDEGLASPLRGRGLIHVSHLAWDPVRNPAQVFKVGQTLPAVLSHVDLEQGRVFLSFRLATPNPLQQTLDSMLGLSTSAAAARGGGGSRAADSLNGTTAGWYTGESSSSSGGGHGGRETSNPREGGAGEAPGSSGEPQVDLRTRLGDMEVAVRFAEALRRTPGIEDAQLGVRLQSRAASQALEVRGVMLGCSVALVCTWSAPVGYQLQVYIAKDDPALGDGSQAGEGSHAAAACQYRLVLRQGLDVQEVALVASLSREEVRRLVAATVVQLAEAGGDSQ
ncbi:hypothetical protein N2152v2_008763 [Parachlorella kessleri]